MRDQETIWDKLYSQSLSWKKETANLPELLRGKSVLEVGVGNGKTLKSILKQSPKSVLAIDISQEALNLASKSIKSEKVKFQKSNIASLNFKNELDVIVCYYTLNNLLEKERKEALASFYNALKRKGIILFEDFAAGDFRQKKKRKDGLICHFFTKSDLESLFKKFSKIKISEKTFSPFRANHKLQRRIISAIVQK